MMLTGAFLTPGNRVDVTLNGDGTYPRLWQDLQSAKHSITLQATCAASRPRRRTFHDQVLTADGELRSTFPSGAL
jgi:hypothetical protein